MVPCPAALIVLLLALKVGRLTYGLALIMAFSLGLAAVLVVIGLLVVMKLIGASSIEWGAFPYLLTYTQNFMPPRYYDAATGHLWSLAVEEHFYLVWPVLFIINKRVAAVLATIFIVGALRVLPDMYAVGHEVWTFPAAMPIAAGCLTAYALRNTSVQRAFQVPAVASILLTLSLAGLASPWFTYIDYVFVPAACLLLMYIYFRQESVLVKLLEFKPLALLGVMSYGAYVWHAILAGTGPYRHNGATFPVEMNTGLVLTAIVVPMSYYGVELRFLKLKDRFRQKPATTRQPVHTFHPEATTEIPLARTSD